MSRVSPMSQLTWAMPVTTEASENTTFAPVSAKLVEVAEEDETVSGASLRKWLDRLGEAWLSTFPNTTVAAAALLPLIACEEGAGPDGKVVSTDSGSLGRRHRGVIPFRVRRAIVIA
jgi:hypothetical protein